MDWIQTCRHEFDSICNEKISNKEKIEKLRNWKSEGNKKYGFSNFGYFSYLVYGTISNLEGSK